MSLFFESIRLINGRMMNLQQHQYRIDMTLRSNSGDKFLNLHKHLKAVNLPKSGIYKIRVSYDVHQVVFTDTKIEKYKEKPIHSLKLININFDYQHKSEDRLNLDRAYAQKESADDVLLIKNGLVTDTWYCNVAFYNGKKWLTPQHPLLLGTMRAKLVTAGKIVPTNIQVQDLASFTKVRLFNSMIPWSQQKDIPIHRIV